VTERLEDRFTLLTGGSRTARPRQRTLRALIDWSYELCAPAERLLWNRLSVFTGGFGLDAAETVGAGEGIARQDVLDLLDRLVAQSVVLINEREGQPRYWMLETIRQYGSERLAESGEEQRTRTVHRDFYRHRAERIADGWYGTGQEEGLARLRAEHGNLRTALEHSDPQTALALVAALRFHPPARASCTATAPPTATNATSPTLTASTSAAIPSTTSASATATTPARARASPASKSTPCSRPCPPAWNESNWPANRSAPSTTSPAASEACSYASADALPDRGEAAAAAAVARRRSAASFGIVLGRKRSIRESRWTYGFQTEASASSVGGGLGRTGPVVARVQGELAASAAGRRQIVCADRVGADSCSLQSEGGQQPKGGCRDGR
jgi:hypothetical protein